ncbi:4-(cytidine 5'-diphospho)-2-C-methyl-D-erythritol kinase [Nakamurella lactea]|uniref:4-(cytidine 5'-diphospho)-2-C-methyl-D-erythritol kinase n=1 Tax=Nakamurella lactea TaxID=459515 RepID=UPI0004117F90|nr:4-(cytidine 5'-diphospho)-2-C-methyl-D-erythritol kinase [Nakamurella lactea]
MTDGTFRPRLASTTSDPSAGGPGRRRSRRGSGGPQRPRDDRAPVRVRVPAKINLALAVGDLREDGFHELSTVFHAVDLYDELTVRPAARWSVRTNGYGTVPAGLNNLAGKAARQLQATLREHGVYGVQDGPVAIEIDKQIPVAGGMAGGSADAAAALVACNQLWDAQLTPRDLAEIGQQIGSDVPFALLGGTAVGAGRGELLSPVLTRMTLHWVLALADEGLSTPEVFGELDRLRAAGRPLRAGSVDEMIGALRSGDVNDVAAALGNDLQAAAISLNPGLRRTVRAGTDAGALGAVVSGSGPTVALLCTDARHAGEVAAQLAGTGTCRAVRVATGPVPGARIMNGIG